MTMRATRLRALGLFASVSLPLAALAHIGLEAATSAASFGSIATPRHLLLAIVVAIVFIAALRATGTFADDASRRRTARLLAAALPSRGRGAAFFALFLSGQGAFVIGTMLLEGSLPNLASCFVAIACAAVALGLASLVLWTYRATIVVALGTAMRARETRVAALRCARAAIVRASRANYFTLFAPNRPPPLLVRTR